MKSPESFSIEDFAQTEVGAAFLKPEQLEKPLESEKIKEGPVLNFLRAHGFEGEAGVVYSLDILNKAGRQEVKKFTDYSELQDFISRNFNIIANNKLIEGGRASYRIDYNDAVYKWSKSLAPEQQQTLNKGWDIVGQNLAILDKTEKSPITENAVIKIGSYVQWTSQGAAQFQKPRKIVGLSEDGKWAFVDGAKTGIPVSQLNIEPASKI